MAHDVEMNEVKAPLMETDVMNEKNDIKIPDVDFKLSKPNEEFTGLTKEELERYANDPFWRKLRLVLFIGFWLVWLGMLVVAILIVVLSPKCPTRPKLEFWEKETGYWLDTMAFVDSDGNGVGDFDGLLTRLDYIQNQLGAGYIILDPVFAGQFSNNNNMIGSVNSFRDLDALIGDRESFKRLIKESRKRGLEIILTADFNALHESSNFLNDNPDASMKFDTNMELWWARDGGTSLKDFKSKNVYSSLSQKSNMIDLNLKNDAVLKEIKESVKSWLDLGVRGFLLTNAAVYVENSTIPKIPTTYKFGSNWYKNASMGGQIFSHDTIDFLREIRSVMDEKAKSTDKSQLLILDAGNSGFGLPQSSATDVMLQYLNGPGKVVDMIIGREFLRNRGWNVDDSDLSKSSVKNYLQQVPIVNHPRIALGSATSTSLRTTSLQKLAAPFLLPGNPFIYFGSEIGEKCKANINSIRVPFYPGDRKFPLYNITDELSTRCNHMIMPWDNSGKIFYNGKNNSGDAYITTSEDTVQGLMAIGRQESLLQLHQKLIKVRSEPSLQWGRIDMFLDKQTANSNHEIFVREATGFPKIIVALLKDSIEGRVFSLSSVCAKIVPLVVYPMNPNLPENKEVEAGNVYLKIGKDESVHVFKCAT